MNNGRTGDSGTCGYILRAVYKHKNPHHISRGADNLSFMLLYVRCHLFPGDIQCIGEFVIEDVLCVVQDPFICGMELFLLPEKLSAPAAQRLDKAYQLMSVAALEYRTVLLLALGAFGMSVGRADGVILLVVFAAFLILMIRAAKSGGGTSAGGLAGHRGNGDPAAQQAETPGLAGQPDAALRGDSA